VALHEIVRDHPYDDTCFGCRAARISFNLSPEFRAVEHKERRLRRDLDAYKRLRQEGLQPQTLTGAADLEARAAHPVDVEHTDNPVIKHMTDGQKNDFIEATKTAAPMVEAG